MNKLVAVALAALLLLVPVGAVALPEAGSAGNTPTNETQAAGSESEYTLDELSKSGRKTWEDGPDSLRSLGPYSTVTVLQYPVGPGSDDWNYLSPGTTVHSNKIGIKTVRLAPEGEFDPSLNLTIVAWQRETVTVQEGNTTRTEQRATNVSVYHEQISAGRGYQTSDVSLPAHYDETYQITMWIEGIPEARWTFAHRSVETTRAVAISNIGEYWQYTAKNLLIWIVGAVGTVAVGVPGLLRKTGRGPNKGLGWWTLVLGFASVCVAAGAYVWTASVIASIPPVVAFVIAGLIAVVMLEKIEYGVSRVVLLRLFAEDTTNLRGELASEAKSADMTILTVANTDDGTKAIHDGIRPFLSRLWTGGTRLRGVDRLDWEFTLSAPKLEIASPVADELVIVDGDTEDVLKYRPETVEFDLDLVGEDGANWDRLWEVSTTFAVVTAVVYQGAQYLDIAGGLPVGIALGALAVYVRHAEPVEGYAEFRPAVGHAQDAVATALTHERELGDYETLEEALGMAVSERNSRDGVEEILEQLDKESVVIESSERGSGDWNLGESSSNNSDTAAGAGD